MERVLVRRCIAGAGALTGTWNL